MSIFERSRKTSEGRQDSSRIRARLYARVDPRATFGPFIQTRYKEYYFASEATSLPIDIGICDGRSPFGEEAWQECAWHHFLFPSDCIESIRTQRNFSIGPNIPLAPIFGPARPKFERAVLAERWIVADSEWNKSALLQCFPELDTSRIAVIPIYVGDHFRIVRMQPRTEFVVGCVGYPDDKSEIKNLDAVLTLARRRRDWVFEFIVNRSEVPDSFTELPNVRLHLNVANHHVPEIMKHWSCYLGISKRERGPATIQEANTMGCPTVCANHTGYACFHPLVPLDLPPFEPLSPTHIRYVEDVLADVAANRDSYLERAAYNREAFWLTQTSERITRLWKQLFLEAAANSS